MAATLCLDSLSGHYQSRVQVNINNGSLELRKTLVRVTPYVCYNNNNINNNNSNKFIKIILETGGDIVSRGGCKAKMTKHTRVAYFLYRSSRLYCLLQRRPSD